MLQTAIGSDKNNEVENGSDEWKVLEKIMAFKEPYRSMGLSIHNIVKEKAPGVVPRVWYGMAGYAKSKSQPVLFFFRQDEDIMTIGYTEKVAFRLDEGSEHKLMPCAWFFHEMDEATERKIGDIVRKAFMG